MKSQLTHWEGQSFMLLEIKAPLMSPIENIHLFSKKAHSVFLFTKNKLLSTEPTLL